MNKLILSLKSIKIILTFFFLWITTQFNVEVENSLAYIFILSLGILHGSNDLTLMRSMTKGNIYDFKKDLGLYLGGMIFTFVIFILWPVIGLFMFILISGYHFGEQHLGDKMSSSAIIKMPLFTLYGLLIFFMLFYVHYEEVEAIVSGITNLSIDRIYYKYLYYSSLSAVLLYCTVVYSLGKLQVSLIEELAYVILFYILFMNSSLLWSFAIYFIVWHSLPSLKDQLFNIYGVISKESITGYLKSSVLYWIISVIGIYLLFAFTKDDLEMFNFLFVTLLASITLPHVIVLRKMHK